MKFSLSQKLSEAQKTQLNAWREQLRGALSATERHEKHHKTLCDKMEELRTRHTKLEERAAGGDENASVKLHGVIDQKMRLQRSIEVAGGDAHSDAERLRSAVNYAVQGMGFMIRDFQNQIEDALEEALAPFFSGRDRARFAARDNDLIRALGIRFNPPLGHTVAELAPLAREFAKTIERLLAGGVVWEYAPAGAAAAQVAA